MYIAAKLMDLGLLKQTESVYCYKEFI